MELPELCITCVCVHLFKVYRSYDILVRTSYEANHHDLELNAVNRTSGQTVYANHFTDEVTNNHRTGNQKIISHQIFCKSPY